MSSTRAASKVLFVANALEPAGAERVLIGVASGLDRARFAPSVLCLHHMGRAASELGEGVPARALGLPHRLPGPPLLALAREIRRQRPDIVHTFHVNAHRWATLAARLGGVRVVINSLQNVFPLHSRRDDLLDRACFTLASHGIACADAVRSFYVERKRFPRPKLTTVYNAIPLERFPMRRASRAALLEAGVPSRYPIIGTVAHLHEQKGHRYLLQAVPRVLEQFPEAAFVLVGDGALREDLERQAKAERVDHAVFFLGLRSSVAELLEGLDVFVLPSLWEGVSVALVEALASGAPSIATRVGGTAEIIVDGETGVLIPPRDPGAIAGAVIRLLTDPDLAARCRTHGRRQVESRFSQERMARGYADVYERVAERQA